MSSRKGPTATTREMADKIVFLLLNGIGHAGELAGQLKPRPPAEAPSPAPPTERRPMTRNRKATPEVSVFIVDRMGIPPAELIHLVRERFGVSISTGLVYKVWKRHLERTSVERSEALLRQCPAGEPSTAAQAVEAQDGPHGSARRGDLPCPAAPPDPRGVGEITSK